jgi:hypothetical protein
MPAPASARCTRSLEAAGSAMPGNGYRAVNRRGGATIGCDASLQFRREPAAFMKR